MSTIVRTSDGGEYMVKESMSEIAVLVADARVPYIVLHQATSASVRYMVVINNVTVVREV